MRMRYDILSGQKGRRELLLSPCFFLAVFIIVMVPLLSYKEKLKNTKDWLYLDCGRDIMIFK